MANGYPTPTPVPTPTPPPGYYNPPGGGVAPFEPPFTPAPPYTVAPPYTPPVSGGGRTQYEYGGWYPNPAAGGQVMRWWNGVWTTGEEPGGGGQPTQPSTPSQPSAEELERQRREAEARGAIESGYSDYFAQLDAMLEQGLPAQRTAQEELARLQYTGGVEQLQPQLTAGETLLQRQRERTETSQARNLRDLAANLRNAFMTGNIFLGARGAGDSSAARMYSYALTKLASQQRGDIMTQTADVMREIGDREMNLQNVYNAEVNRLASERDQKIMSIASWFAEQQNALRGAKAEGALRKGQDLATLSQNLLSAALNQLNFVQQEASNRRAALEQWALNNATSIQQVKANLQQVSQFQPTLPQAQPIAGQPTIQAGGGFNVPGYAPIGYGTRRAEEEERPLFQPVNYLA